MNTITGLAVSGATINTSKSRKPLGARSPNIRSANSGKSQANTSKSKLPSMKPPRGDYSKLASLASASENFDEWTEKRCCDDDVAFKASLSVDSSDELCREGDDSSLSIFREMADYNDQEDMMVLKRANPVYDSDDEDYMAAPTKRQRTKTTSSSMVLSWSSHVSTDPSGGFSIRLQHH